MDVLLDGMPVGWQTYKVTAANAQFWPEGTTLTSETTPAVAGSNYQMSFQASFHYRAQFAATQFLLFPFFLQRSDFPLLRLPKML